MNPKPAETLLPASVIEAYNKAVYHVFDDPPFMLRIGKVSPELAHVYERFSVASACFITAYNPFGETVSRKENAQQQAALTAMLKQRRLSQLDGDGRDAVGKWPGEPSQLVLGISYEEAKLLGSEFRQNALVWVGSDRVPKLVLLR